MRQRVREREKDKNREVERDRERWRKERERKRINRESGREKGKKMKKQINRFTGMIFEGASSVRLFYILEKGRVKGKCGTNEYIIEIEILAIFSSSPYFL